MTDLLQHPGESGNNSLPPEEKATAHARRTFFFKISVLLNAAVGTVLAIPLVGYLLGPVFKKDSSVGSWINIGQAHEFPVGETRLVNFQSPVRSLGDGETAKLPCWVRHGSARQFEVFAINCAHLGCPVRWFAQAKLFLCPCHGGAYYEDGSRAAGPPQRGLFKYKSKLVGDSLMIHAGNMPTLATQASCQGKPLLQIQPAVQETRFTPWQA